MTNAMFSFGRSSRPAIRIKVPDIEILLRTNRTARISFPSFPTTGMSFHGNKGCFPFYFCLILENISQCFPDHHFWNRYVCGFQKGGSQIAQVYQCMRNPSGFSNPFRPTNGKGNMSASIVKTRLGPGKGHAMITGDHDDGIVKLTKLLK